MQDIGRNIRDTRLAQKITQDELAEKLFVSRQTVSNYETGRTRPDIDTLLRIAEVLAVDAEALLYGSSAVQTRQREKKKLLIACVILAGLGLLCAVVSRLDLSGRQHYMLGISALPEFIFRPCLLLLLGWSLLQGASLLPKAKLPRYHAKYVYRTAAVTVLIYFLLILPFCIGILALNWQAWQHMSGAEGAYIQKFYIPVVNEFAAFAARHTDLLQGAFLPLGALLWLSGGKNKTADFQ